MSNEAILTNARIITSSEEVYGTVLVRDGRITEVSAGRSHATAASDLEGDYLLPGLVELHTDNFEKHFAPRPGVKWPSIPAIMAHDAQMAAVGITTVFNSVTLGDVRVGTDRMRDCERIIEAVCAVAERRTTRAEHRIHLRCEISADNVVQMVDRWIHRPQVGLISINDHTPGQRQFFDAEKCKLYHVKKYGMTNEDFEIFKMKAFALREKNAARHRTEIVTRAKARTLPIASHDDGTREHVDEAIRDGIVIAEFPTTWEAAEASREAGFAILVGAPNLVLGGSHVGNIAANDLVSGGLVSILSSDYVPASLIVSVFRLSMKVNDISLSQAVRLASLNPARAVGLADRGEIAADRRADLIRVCLLDGEPLVRTVWREGERVV